MAWGMGGQRAAERAFSHEATWEAIHVEFDRRYPGYRGLQPGAKKISRSEYRRYVDKHALGADVFVDFWMCFEAEMAKKTVLGTRWGSIEAWLPFDGERIILSMFSIDKSDGGDEMTRGIDAVIRLHADVPGGDAAVWDGSLHGGPYRPAVRGRAGGDRLGVQGGRRR
jgi:hypothetical protein